MNTSSVYVGCHMGNPEARLVIDILALLEKTLEGAEDEVTASYIRETMDTLGALKVLAWGR